MRRTKTDWTLKKKQRKLSRDWREISPSHKKKKCLSLGVTRASWSCRNLLWRTRRWDGYVGNKLLQCFYSSLICWRFCDSEFRQIALLRCVERYSQTWALILIHAYSSTDLPMLNFLLLTWSPIVRNLVVPQVNASSKSYEHKLWLCLEFFKFFSILVWKRIHKREN